MTRKTVSCMCSTRWRALLVHEAAYTLLAPLRCGRVGLTAEVGLAAEVVVGLGRAATTETAF